MPQSLSLLFFFKKSYHQADFWGSPDWIIILISSLPPPSPEQKAHQLLLLLKYSFPSILLPLLYNPLHVWRTGGMQWSLQRNTNQRQKLLAGFACLCSVSLYILRSFLLLLLRVSLLFSKQILAPWLMGVPACSSVLPCSNPIEAQPGLLNWVAAPR